MKEKLQKFFEKFTIKKKIVIACIPFLLISYIILFLFVLMVHRLQSKFSSISPFLYGSSDLGIHIVTQVP